MREQLISCRFPRQGFLQAETQEEQGLDLLLKANGRRLTAPIEKLAKIPVFNFSPIIPGENYVLE